MKGFVVGVVSCFVVIFVVSVIYPLDLFASITMTPWVQSSPLPNYVASHTSFIRNNRIYIEGGANTVTVPYQSSSNILENHFVDTWSVDGDSPDVFWHSQTTFNNFVYLLGGATNPLVTYTKNIYKSDLSLNPLHWDKIGELPNQLSMGGVFFDDNILYYLGGHMPTNPPLVNQEIYKTDVDPVTGSLGSWSSGGLLPEPLTAYGLIKWGKFVFVISGFSGITNSDTNKVWRGEIKSTGIIEDWTPMPNLPLAMNRFHTTLVGNTILVTGGHLPSGDSNKTYLIEIDSLGNLGDWQAGIDLPSPICCGAIVSVGNYAYLTGGARNGTYLNSIYMTEVTEILPTPTPTPTPTLVPTPTSTPPPPQTTKVVLIPGMFGSWNSEALLQCKMNDYTEPWSINPVSLAVYSPLIAGLELGGFDVEMFFYDWRKPIPEISNQFSNFVNGLIEPGEKIHIVGHSQGALIGSDYIEKSQGVNTEKFMAIGGPNKGLLVAYPDWAGGIVWNDDLLYRLGQEVVLKYCQHNKSKQVTIQTNMPVIQNLLPTFDYLIDKKTVEFIPVLTMKNKNSWLPTNFSPPYWGVRVGTLSGTGQLTLNSFNVHPPSKHDLDVGLWTDGKIVGRVDTYYGDGSVLLFSSQLPDAENMVIYRGHISMVNSIEGVINVVKFLVNDVPSGLQGINYDEPKSALLVISDAEIELSSPSNKLVPSGKGVTVALNPESGIFNIKIKPTKTITELKMAQLLPDGRIVWHDYSISGKGEKKGTIEVDGKEPRENPFKLGI